MSHCHNEADTMVGQAGLDRQPFRSPPGRLQGVGGAQDQVLGTAGSLKGSLESKTE